MTCPVRQSKWQAAVRPGEGLPDYEDVMLGSLGSLADHTPLESKKSLAEVFAPRPLSPESGSI